MITTLQSGNYKLIETKNHIKVLYLDDKAYAWINAKNVGELLVLSRNPHKTDCVLGLGKYYLYDVEDEPYKFDLQHLELQIGDNAWQGYLLLSGLPGPTKKMARLVPTEEVITGTVESKQLFAAHRPI